MVQFVIQFSCLQSQKNIMLTSHDREGGKEREKSGCMVKINHKLNTI